MTTKINRRRIYFIEKKFQARFIVKFCAIVILGTLVMGAWLYLFSSRSTTVSLENTRAVVKTTADFLLPLLLQTLIVITVFVGIATIILTLFISHKIAGPLYRFKKELSTVEAGDLSHDFHIRKNDQLQDLALSMNNAIKKLRETLAELKKQYSVLKNSWEHSLVPMMSQDKKIIEEMKKTMEEMKKRLDYFKI
jgi:methyl-accepting chemotaxis protein